MANPSPALPSAFVAMQVKPGEVRNPAGRPKVDPKLLKEAWETFHSALPHAAKRLKELIDSPDDSVALRAIETLLNRVIGKVESTLTVNKTDGTGEAFVKMFRDLLSTRVDSSVIDAVGVKVNSAVDNASPLAVKANSVENTPSEPDNCANGGKKLA